MALRLSEIVLQSRDPEALARFWCAALDYVILDQEEDGTLEIGPSGGFGSPQPTIILSTCAEPTPNRGRLHFDLNAMSSTQEEEIQRLRELGATDLDIGQSGEEGWVVLQDPEGNAFCVLKAVLEP